jgi:hypothetical protein
MGTRWFKYVAFDHIPVWEALGWVATDALEATHHGHYAVLMQWTGEGEPKVPHADR